MAQRNAGRPRRSGLCAHPHFAGAVSYTAYARPSDDEAATGDTIAMMYRLISADADSPAVRAAAHEAAIQGVHAWVRRRVRLIQDAELARPVPGANPDSAEVLVRPADLLRMRLPAGDCDDHAMLAASMLAALGIPSQLRTIAADPTDPDSYSHVYLMVRPAGGPPVPLDASHGPTPGWQAASQGKSRTWRAPMTLRDVDWGQVLASGIETGVKTTSEILKARYAQPPAGTYIQQGQNVLYRQLPGTEPQFPTTQITGGWTGIILLAAVALVLILALRGR